MRYRVRTISEIETIIHRKSHLELAKIVTGVAMWLWIQDGDDEMYLDPDKEWEPYTLEGIADELLQHGIGPEDYDMPIED